MLISEVRHQDDAVRLIQQALFADRLPHAYIFHGPDGVGKESLAGALAGVLLCADPVTTSTAAGERRLDACGTCQECRLLAAGNHPDLHLIYRQLNQYHKEPEVRRRKAIDLGVDVIRQFVVDKVGAKPQRGRAKVFLIREADRITPQAQNALLKTLEEPPQTTFLILLVASLNLMLPTIRSRCHLTPFGILPTEFIADRLAELLPELPAGRAQLCARFAEGSLGRALQHAEDALDEHNQRVVRTLVELPRRKTAEVASALEEEARALGARYSARDREISDTEALRRGLKTVLGLAAMWYRDLLHLAAGSAEPVANVSHADELRSAADGTTLGRTVAAISQLARTEEQLDANVNTRLSLDALAIRLGRLAVA